MQANDFYLYVNENELSCWCTHWLIPRLKPKPKKGIHVCNNNNIIICKRGFTFRWWIEHNYSSQCDYSVLKIILQQINTKGLPTYLSICILHRSTSYWLLVTTIKPTSLTISASYPSRTAASIYLVGQVLI